MGTDNEEYARVVDEIEIMRECRVGLKNAENEKAWKDSKLDEFKSYLAAQGTLLDLPQNPTQGGEWEHKFNNDQREVYTNRIGNLVLLSRKKNSSANNRPFNEKKISYYQKGITDFDLTKEIQSYNDWTPSVIDKRQNECIQRLKSIWID